MCTEGLDVVPGDHFSLIIGRWTSGRLHNKGECDSRQVSVFLHFPVFSHHKKIASILQQLRIMATPKFSDSFTFLPQSAIIQEFKVGGRNIVLGFPSAASYKTGNSPFFGETIGRVANRISGARIDNLNGKSYSLSANNGPNTLHGGTEGWGKKDFEGPTPTTRGGRDAVMFNYLSHDGEEGYPGTVELRVWYFPGLEKDLGVEKTSLEIEYEVELVGDEVEETIVGVTNHRYDHYVSTCQYGPANRC